MFLTSQPYDFDAFAHTGGPFGCRMTVQNFVKIVWTVFEKFEIFMKRSGEKKQHDCISSRKFFPTPKNYILDFNIFGGSSMNRVETLF